MKNFNVKKKNGFSLIAAIFFIILISTIALTSLSIATLATKSTATMQAKEQAEFLAQSATEFAVMAMQAHDYTQNCLQTATLYYPSTDESERLFTINVDFYYLDNNLPNCDSKHIIGVTKMGQDSTASTTNSHAAIVDVNVTSATLSNGSRVRYSRRTLQIP